MKKKVGEILLEKGWVTDEQVKKALGYSKAENCKIGEALVNLEICSQEQVSRALAIHFQLPFANLGKHIIPQEIIDSVPKEVALEHKIVPVARKGRTLVIAMGDPLDFFTIDNLRFILSTEVDCALATPAAVEEALDDYYRLAGGYDSVLGADAGSDDDLEFGRGEFAGDDGDANEAPVIKLVHMIIADALKASASDIHIEPMESELRVRYRIDGVCKVMESPPKKLQGPVISRLKIMSRMDMAEKRRPQDGRIKIKIQGREIDLRVSIIPSVHGESVVMRILDKDAGLVDLEKLGFHESDLARFNRIIKRPNGIFLVTGPTGSGKTTTLYSALMDLNRPDVKIITAEHPIEYNLTGINQAEVKHEIGLDFSRILRAMMRQAPNIILVGEIRDRETADTAIQAALTGHLVFSTLHTNDAPSALTRLIDMGVKPFLVASAVLAIMGQRLIRVLCKECKEAYEPTETELRMVGLSSSEIADQTLYRPVGCPKCSNGYKGRCGIYELLEMSSELRDMTFNKTPSKDLRNKARSEGMVSLQEDAVRKLLSGITTIEEILRVTHSSEFSS
ncbi:MAG: Flp pilus assembly complex ATPase component TadA [Planctomycetes bacterium]|jgi:type IV pilus assembly protein PilB|nr:Flp pilus assembly complex ATPase component TadA [Planctomycetota bacterium]MBT6785189.1 Flp pilus assembly complex ATPase component TadA [Planctomycetota bacterium]MBT6969362.1 Flp pilus assembly complex ATPase component TadA [Planctomycetota bacterium]MBT7103335.1 Flp pilus assembly complex ATPase component TadA [Planctomycetota bacterium]MBT7129926.1 Flp pilus assembly complex ATPase component TadA [Planctomycetota bacterium]